MNWQRFQTYNEAPTRAFEAMCNQLFELWVNREYKETKQSFVVVNGSGGDGGVESYAVLVTGEKIAVQAKWFPDSIAASQFNQIKSSILTALEVHPQLIKYIVCVPRNLSNSKKGKNEKIVQKTEYSKWEKIVAEIKGIYPNVEIVLWGDHSLESQLQYTEAAGVRRYWFENEEISKEIIQDSFDKQKQGWLVQRYIPVLHNRGTISRELGSFLGDLEECNLLFGELKTIEKNYELLITEIDALCVLLREKKLYDERIEELLEVCNRVKLQRVELDKLKNAFLYENKLEQWSEHILTYEKLGDIEDWLDKCSYGDGIHHFWDVKKLIEKIHNVNMTQLFEKLKQRCNYEKIIVIGGQGTGKTHGIANVVETQLKKNNHIPILIQAKCISPQDEWKDIIIRVLGLSQNWSEKELWSALEALSYRIEVNAAISSINENKICIIPKVVICIDGIDEIKPYDRWNERINQVNVIVSRHPRIRFCFTGRPYAFDNNLLEHEQNLKMFSLLDDGDAPVRTLYDQYIQYYKIDDEGAKWLRYSISTPYALKLLCELYKGRHIGEIGKSYVTVSNLLKEKFVKLNQEFKLMAGIEENIGDQFVKTALLSSNEIFEAQNEVTRTQLKNTLRQLDLYRYLNESGLDQLLDFLEKHSFLQSYKRYSENFFEEDETIYLLGVQPVYDYLKAFRLFEKSDYSDELELDNQVLENIGALQIYSIMVMDSFEKTLWENKSCKENLNEEELFSVVAFALVNVNEEISGKYAEWLKELMSRNAYALSLVVNKIVFPLARNENHPLGSILLDQCLSAFDKPAERDIIWSIPSGLNGHDNSAWIRYEEIEYNNESYELENADRFDGMPLVWAWGLTSVDNGLRTMIRQKITKWGIAQPKEFYKLFEYFANVNDIQAKTDIFAIAMAVTYVCRKNSAFLKSISKWIYHNIFPYGKIPSIRNAAIRYYSRAIMECAYSEKIITGVQIEKCHPPYRKSASLIPFAPEATTGTRMWGYKTLDYDLARYVLCDPLDHKFLSNIDYRSEVDNLIKKYRMKYQLSELTSEKWVLGSAFGFVKEAGWCEDIFYGKPIGKKLGENIGLDIAICSKFRPATHGSMSRVMSITEKYTWCAKMELLGYLSDRLPYYEYDRGNEYVKDYGQLDDYVNPYQELCQVDVEKVMQESEWILPEELCASIDGCNYDEDGIQKWLNESPIPDFEKWINIQHGLVTLFGSHCVSNEIQGVTTTMWISSGLVHKGTIPSLIKKLEDKEFTRELMNVVDFHAYSLSDCYVSPLEVCWFDWKEELNSYLEYKDNVLYKNVTKCTCNLQKYGETEYKIPSKKVREIMGIISGDGYHYYNNKDVEIAFCRNAGEYYGDNQYILLVNEEIFISKAVELNLQPVWLIRVLKETSSKARERLNCYNDRDESYFVWKNSKSWQVRRIE